LLKSVHEISEGRLEGTLVKVAAFQATLSTANMTETLSVIRNQVKRCEAEKVSILCCPETILGGLADNNIDPFKCALSAESGQLKALFEPIASETVATIIGFTEITTGNRLYNSAAVFHRSQIVGLYRKLYPAINRSVYDAGQDLPTFQLKGLIFGIIICNDSNHFELARSLANRGATAMFVPTNNAIAPAKAKEEDVAIHARANDHATAVENRVWVVRADVAGSTDGFTSVGSSEIVDPDGVVVQSATPLTEDLIVAEIDTVSRVRSELSTAQK
jgi:predicted amidohydrolase